MVSRVRAAVDRINVTGNPGQVPRNGAVNYVSDTLLQMNQRRSFRALLQPDGTKLRWVTARVPFDPAVVWKTRRGMRVKGTINGFAFRTSLFGSTEKGYVVLVNKTMQKQAKAGPGELADFTLEPDLEEREAVVPPELMTFLKSDRALARWFAALSYSYRKDICRTISEPKSAESRMRRAEQMAERMLLAMDGERTVPPILQVAFRRAPRAQAGWDAMTPVRRRAHLLGIFYYQSPDARERRAKQAVDEALRIADR
jgi:uncharacterized protein YdeI (YjbR/CyaY-like superfamily)